MCFVNHAFRNKLVGRRDGSRVTNISNFCRGTGLITSTHMAAYKLPVTLAPRDLTLASGLLFTASGMHVVHIYAGKTSIHIKE